VLSSAGPALDAMHDVAFVEQEFGEIAAVLPGDASDEGDFGIDRKGHANFDAVA
jgi:hypothetical protein